MLLTGHEIKDLPQMGETIRTAARLLPIMFVLLGAGLGGCGAPEEPTDGTAGSGGTNQPEASPGGDVGVAASAVLGACKACSAADVSLVFGSDQTAILGPLTSTHVCWASQFGGRNSSLTAYTIVDRLQTISGEKWVIYGGGQMSCVPQCCFWSNQNNAVRWLSGDVATNSTSGCGRVSSDLWWGDAAGMIQGIQRYTGYNGFVFVQDFPGASSPRHMYADAQCSGSVTAWGSSFFVGAPGSGLPVNATGWYNSYLGNTQRMIRASDGICYFTNVGYGLTYPKQSVIQVSPSDGYWYLMTTDTSVQASAQCMYYGQH